MTKETDENIISFLDLYKDIDPEADEIDKMLRELESHLFPADKPAKPRSRSTVRRKFRKLMEKLSELGEDWEGIV